MLIIWGQFLVIHIAEFRIDVIIMASHRFWDPILLIVKAVIYTVRVKILNPICDQKHLVQIVYFSIQFGILVQSLVLWIDRILTFLAQNHDQLIQLSMQNLNLPVSHL